MRTSPLRIVSAPARQRSNVDFPAPLGPAIETTSPAAIVKLIDRSAAREPPPGMATSRRTSTVAGWRRPGAAAGATALPARRVSSPVTASRARRAERRAVGNASIGPRARPARMAAASIAEGASVPSMASAAPVASAALWAASRRVRVVAPTER